MGWWVVGQIVDHFPNVILERSLNCTESTADSEITQTDMKILKAVSKTPNDPPMVPKIFRVYTSPLIEISMDYDFHRIIEYHI